MYSRPLGASVKELWPDHLTRQRAQYWPIVLRTAIRPKWMIGDDIGHTIIRARPGTAAVETVITSIVDTHGCALDGVPVVDSPVHGTVCLVQLPICVRPHDETRLTR